MKRLISKKGFTLLECIVAMAILAIMTICLLMILSVTVRTRYSNMEIEKEIDRQVENIGDDNNVSSTAFTQDIKFDLDGETVGTMPSNGQLITPNKGDNDNADISIGKLKYDFGSFNGTDDYDKKDSHSQYGKYKVYGATEIQSDIVTITECESDTDKSGDTYKITWRVEFTALTTKVEQGVKVVFPIGTSNLTYNSNYSCEVVKIDKYTARMGPIQGVNYVTPWSGVSVIFSFEIPKTTYDNNVGSVSKYFLNKEDTKAPGSAEVKINTEYDANGQELKKTESNS